MQTIDTVLTRLPKPSVTQLLPPRYEHNPSRTVKVGMAVESMRMHMSDEGWQIFSGLQQNGYALAGYKLPISTTDTAQILSLTNPGIIVLQDKREWDSRSDAFREPRARFTNVGELANHPSIFKLTILKDAHQRPGYHLESALEAGIHAWIIYYNPRIVQHLAPYLRSQHIIRTYHTIDPILVPPYSALNRDGCLLSGAVSGAYPLRSLLVNERTKLPHTTYRPHPGYHRNGSCTPDFLKYLTQFKVSICTSSIYGYALRKIIESTAAGCSVITDLPTDEILPHIDGNIYRVRHNATINEVSSAISVLTREYNPRRQAEFSQLALHHYNYISVTKKLADDIESLRTTYTS